LRVALVCPTIGQTRRGYERYFWDLFRFSRDELDIVLFKGGGAGSPRERVVPHLRRTGVLAQLFGESFRHTRRRIEFASFAAAAWPYLMAGGYHLAHFIDPPLGPHFHRLRSLTRLKMKLLFSNAGPMSIDASRWADHIHCLSPIALAEGRERGIPANRMSMIPMGVDLCELTPTASRGELRKRLGIDSQCFVILAIASVNRYHKRIDHLIREVADLSGNFMLWLDGSLHPDGDPTLIEMGRELLGNRFRHTHLESNEIVDLYGAADVFVSTAIHESFGMAISEAMTAGLPVVVHDSAHFRWLVGENGVFADMTRDTALSGLLARFIKDATIPCSTNPETVIARFGWPQVARLHHEMYRQIVEGT